MRSRLSPSRLRDTTFAFRFQERLDHVTVSSLFAARCSACNLSPPPALLPQYVTETFCFDQPLHDGMVALRGLLDAVPVSPLTLDIVVSHFLFNQGFDYLLLAFPVAAAPCGRRVANHYQFLIRLSSSEPALIEHG